jgi:hypothetical protein
MMKNNLCRILLLFTCILLITSKPFAATDDELIKKDTVEVGLWVEDIYNIDYVDRTFEVVFWIWANSTQDTFDLTKYVDLNNAVDVTSTLYYIEKLNDGRVHSECKIRAKFLNSFNVNSFPFDHQVIHINMEFIKEAAHNCVIYRSPEHICNFSPENIEDFERQKFKTHDTLYVEKYSTNFGNTNLGKSTAYHRLEIDIHLNRDSKTIAFKLFVTLLIAFILASSSILLPLKMSEEKFALIVGSLFTAIGNKYISDGMLPFSGSFNLSDSLHMLTFVCITIMALYAVIEQRYQIDRSKKSDLFIFFGAQIVFVASIFLTIFQYL